MEGIREDIKEDIKEVLMLQRRIIASSAVIEEKLLHSPCKSVEELEIFDSQLVQQERRSKMVMKMENYLLCKQYLSCLYILCFMYCPLDYFAC